ncbi:hypothetical protein MLD38_002234 [Melastoma candidum]|uniref:Uncharacterized protein n=1 Tax=Melastoma candidum TaxID=119954 RepID=A0ACB9SHS8_9MYRT|nr:hypothetical protein MLD38_002234 [Melastoma candidum]
MANPPTRPAFSFLLLLSSLFFSPTRSASFGVNYGRIADNLPPPPKVVELLRTNSIANVRLFDTDAGVLSALANSGISVLVSLPNELLSLAASSQSFTDAWVQANVSKYYPSTRIVSVAVGNEVFADPHNTTDYLVPAMRNVHVSLTKYNLSENITVSSPLAFSALQSSYPTSSGAFRADLVELVIKPMLDFLRQTSSSLMVNVYPFFAYTANSDKISLSYALFQENPGVVDSGNGLRYLSLFDAQVDAVYAALSALQYDDIKITVTETGWPSKGDANEVGAGIQNAAAYNGNLVRRVLSGKGTPLRPKNTLDVYMFALFNEDQKPGPTSERNYGLFYPDESRVYEMPLGAPEATSHVGARGGSTWCVANGDVGEERLQRALDFACGEGGADCRPIEKGATCYEPNTVVAHATYAFNSYYQRNARAAGTCYFGGAAYLVTHPPNYGKCEY